MTKDEKIAKTEDNSEKKVIPESPIKKATEKKIVEKKSAVS